MAAQLGRGILLKLENTPGSATYTTVTGLRTANVTLNKEQVDITSADDTARMRQLLATAAVKSMSVSGEGVLKNDTIIKSVSASANSDTFLNWQITVPNIATITGPFQVVMNFAGEHAGEATYDLSLESAGDWTYVAL